LDVSGGGGGGGGEAEDDSNGDLAGGIKLLLCGNIN